MAKGAYIFAPAGPRLSNDEAAFFKESDPFGFIVFARNLEDPDQVRRLTSDLRNAVADTVPVFIDQEGGRVQRLRAPHWKEWLPALDDVARFGPSADAALAIRFAYIASELRAIGIDGNCAPLGDLARPETHAVLRNRCYGTTAAQVASRAQAVATALLEGGVLPVLKHIPGQGRADLDSHIHLPRVSTDHDELSATDFRAFKMLNDLPIGMTSHVVYEDIDELPATQSRKVMDLIRKEIGFSGLMLTDDISMEALKGTVQERGKAALAAGCDIVLHCNGKLDEMQTIAALGPLSHAATERADAALALRRDAKPVDLSALAEDFAALERRLT